MVQYKNHTEEIGLVILDMGMPGMGGEECIKKLKKINDAVKIVIASGYLNHEYASTPREYGAAAFLAKPYQMSELAKQIRTLLEQEDETSA